MLNFYWKACKDYSAVEGLKHVSYLRVQGVVAIVPCENATQSFAVGQVFSKTVLNSCCHLVNQGLIDKERAHSPPNQVQGKLKT